MITASICTIGDEILIGQIVDTNSSKIATALNAIGVKVCSMVSTSDQEQDIINTIEHCAQHSNIIVITGGLGPTKDDITKKTLGKLTGATGFVENKEQLEIIKTYLTVRGVELSDINIAQASVPNSCKVIINDCGTAPCMEFNIPENKYGHKVVIYSLPGVPFEAEAAIPKVVKSIKEHYNLESIMHKTICTFGIAESTLSKIIESWEDNLPENIHLAYLPNTLLGVRLRLSIYGVDEIQGEKELDNEIAKLTPLLGDAIYGEGTDSLEKKIIERLSANCETLAVAESCTGGMLSHLITLVPGASNVFYGGIVSYDNSVKQNILGVSEKILDEYGAVSKECVEQMAIGARKALNTTYAIATSGIAGPSGGTPDKPVGTVWIAFASEQKVCSIKYSFKGNRAVNIQRFASNALNFCRLNIK